MKKMIVIVALVMAACVPAMAAVTVSCSQDGGLGSSVCAVSYTVTGPNSVRAFALDVTLGSGTIASATCSSTAYATYPGSIQISGGSVSSAGSCVCTASEYPGVTKPGIGSSAMTVEMGSLYASGGTKPGTSGLLFKFNTSGALPIAVTLTENTSRGGVVMENPDESAGLTLTNCTLTGTSPECFPSSYTTYQAWKSIGKPDCWCGTNTVGMTAVPPKQWKFQCDGDADNNTENAVYKYRIYLNDYKCLVSNWKKTISSLIGQPGACCDFDHKSENAVYKYRVYLNDYKKVVSNWKKRDSQLSANCPRTE